MAEYIISHGIRVAQNFVPETFGRLTTIGPRFLLPVGQSHAAHQVCECDCGTLVVRLTRNLRSGNTTSCGCVRGAATTLGLYRSSEYRAWVNMRYRCYRPQYKNYPYYGGRGIRVCDRWLGPETGFINFLADMGERPSKTHSLDRIDVNDNYCPENCRWATAREQTRNQRSNVLLTYQGKTQCIMDWAEELNIEPVVVYYRISRGWPAERALTQPVRSVRILRK